VASLKSLPPWSAADLAQLREDIAEMEHRLETLAFARSVSLEAEEMRLDGMRRAGRSLARLYAKRAEAEA
jgi:hypothetical protein